MREDYAIVADSLSEAGRYTTEPEIAEWKDYTVATVPVYPGGVNNG